MIEAGIETWSGRGRTGHALIREDPINSSPTKRVELQRHGLVGGRNPCVPDDGHRSPVSQTCRFLGFENSSFETGFQDSRLSASCVLAGNGGPMGLTLINPSFSRQTMPTST